MHVFFSPSRHNISDIELKFYIFVTSLPLTSHKSQNLKTLFKKIKIYSFSLLIKLMDLLNMTNRAKIHEFYIFQARVLKFCD